MTKLESRKPLSESIKVIENETLSYERALYNSSDCVIKNVKFEGDEDGESALKESSNIVVEDCLFALRYPLWHVKGSIIINSKFLETCRAPLWYDKDLEVRNCTFSGVKIFRECKNIDLIDCDIKSEEPFWRCNGIAISNSSIDGFYAFFSCKDTCINNMNFKGKYSFQYNKNLVISNSTLDTKDAFWHAKNVVIKDSTIKGEYLGWYSENITFINCVIESHQPLCYAKNIKLIDCKMPNSDLAFEYSTVKGNIIGKVDSIKNPLRGKLKADEIGELVLIDSKYKSHCKVVINNK